MKYLTLDYIHAHSRIVDTADDTLLTSYAGAAEDATLKNCNTTYEKMVEEYGEIPDGIMVATLMLVENLYVNRSPDASIKMSEVPYTYDFFIKPYMKLCYPTDEEDDTTTDTTTETTTSDDETASEETTEEDAS